MRQAIKKRGVAERNLGLGRRRPLFRSAPWGFDVAEIRVPTQVVYGTSDVLVPRRHGEWLARNVPGAEVVVEEEQGHIPDPALVRERYAVARPASLNPGVASRRSAR